MKVYRLQIEIEYNDNKIIAGPFSTKNTIEFAYDVYEEYVELFEMVERHTNNKRYFDLPIPYDDGIGFIRENEYCGCQSMELLLEWFPLDMLLDLLSIGFRVFEYDIDERYVRVGGKQVTFELGMANYRKVIDPYKFIYENNMTSIMSDEFKVFEL